MEKINAFIQHFGVSQLDHVHKKGRRYYQVAPRLWRFAQTIPRDVYHIGTFLGENKKPFVPSLALLDLLSVQSERKVFLNTKGAWLFTCNRDVFEENIIKASSNGLCLVQDAQDENLGYGRLSRKNKKLFLHPLLDKGDYLRRERHSKRKKT